MYHPPAQQGLWCSLPSTSTGLLAQRQQSVCFLTYLVDSEGDVSEASLLWGIFHQLPVHGPKLVKLICKKTKKSNFLTVPTPLFIPNSISTMSRISKMFVMFLIIFFCVFYMNKLFYFSPPQKNHKNTDYYGLFPNSKTSKHTDIPVSYLLCDQNLTQTGGACPSGRLQRAVNEVALGCRHVEPACGCSGVQS